MDDTQEQQWKWDSYTASIAWNSFSTACEECGGTFLQDYPTDLYCPLCEEVVDEDQRGVVDLVHRRLRQAAEYIEHLTAKGNDAP
jgi:uncharacterized Zn finger protein (UPF0148 family)